jgi:hypothetical protein
MINPDVISGLREGLELRGYGSLNDLSHADQQRVAGVLKVKLTDLHRELRRTPQKRTVAPKRAASRSVTTPSRASLTDYDWAYPLANDDGIFAKIKVAERDFGLDPHHNRTERYLRATAKLAEVRKLGYLAPELVSDRAYDRAKFHMREIRGATRDYFARTERSEIAKRNLARQTAAARESSR